ncbi:hypothetical protein M3D43_007045 [Micrococcus luteus]|nr:hypothetical protein [Micrococcus luteus]
MPSVLFVLSASDHWTLKDGTRHETGFWAEEFVVPHDVFADAGWDVAVATPGGVAPTVDQTSLGLMGGAPWKTDRLKRDLERRGADYSSATLPYRPHVVVDRHLYTGQNPQSSRPLAERILADAAARR